MTNEQIIKEASGQNGLLIEMLYAFFPKKMARLSNSIMTRKALQIEKAAEENKIRHQNIEMEMMIGRPVIAFGNNNSSPVVGFVVRYEMVSRAEIPTPVIYNYLTDTEVLCMAPVYPFTMQRMRLAEQLTGEQIWSLIMRHAGNDMDYNPNESTGTKNHEYHGHDVLYGKLVSRGFISKYHQYLEDVRTAELREFQANSRP